MHSHFVSLISASHAQWHLWRSLFSQVAFSLLVSGFLSLFLVFSLSFLFFISYIYPLLTWMILYLVVYPTKRPRSARGSSLSDLLCSGFQAATGCPNCRSVALTAAPNTLRWDMSGVYPYSSSNGVLFSVCFGVKFIAYETCWAAHDYSSLCWLFSMRVARTLFMMVRFTLSAVPLVLDDSTGVSWCLLPFCHEPCIHVSARIFGSSVSSLGLYLQPNFLSQASRGRLDKFCRLTFLSVCVSKCKPGCFVVTYLCPLSATGKSPQMSECMSSRGSYLFLLSAWKGCLLIFPNVHTRQSYGSESSTMIPSTQCSLFVFFFEDSRYIPL